MLPRPSLRVIKSRENCCLLNVRNSSHSRTCLPENVCKFSFHCYAYAYAALMSMIAGLRSVMKIMDHPHLYEREYKNYVKASKAFISEQNDGIFLSCEILRLTTAAYEK
ncbi:F-box/LRR-repeat protein [Trichinella spiralis]|uniref:F-box/LRR-repeat protein n=1 Tax=Trichinella spiralis TaxID=6334 RepID=UPI0001EFB9FA|nr:F-box/LRR-repeat protein [Trichinella spiralis]